VSEELVEALARRLELASQRVYPRDVPCPVPSGMGPVRWQDVARECLRQMEWARQNCNALFVRDGANKHRVVDVVQYLPLTLAPEDWKP
jgi:hypothetical protein